MYDYNMDYVQQLAGLSELQRREYARYYAKLPESVRLEAHAIQTDLMRQNRQHLQAGCMPEFSYAMLLVALMKMRSIEGGIHRKGGLTLEQARRISEIRIARAKAERTRKESPTRHKLELRHGEEIKRLREQEGFSWRDVARFLEKNYRLKVSHTYLRKVYSQKAGSEDTPTS